MRRFRRWRRAYRHMNRLQNAHRLYNIGNFLETGKVFEELATLAKSGRRPRAPQLFRDQTAICVYCGSILEALM